MGAEMKKQQEWWKESEGRPGLEAEVEGLVFEPSAPWVQTVRFRNAGLGWVMGRAKVSDARFYHVAPREFLVPPASVLDVRVERLLEKTAQHSLTLSVVPCFEDARLDKLQELFSATHVHPATTTLRLDASDPAYAVPLS